MVVGVPPDVPPDALQYISVDPELFYGHPYRSAGAVAAIGHADALFAVVFPFDVVAIPQHLFVVQVGLVITLLDVLHEPAEAVLEQRKNVFDVLGVVDVEGEVDARVLFFFTACHEHYLAFRRVTAVTSW